jgi:glutaredoxin-like protein NrdH
MLTLYSKPACPFCDQAKNYLHSQAVQFEVIDITEDAEAMNFIKEQGHRTVPQIYKNSELFVEGGWMGLSKLGRHKLLEMLGE